MYTRTPNLTLASSVTPALDIHTDPRTLRDMILPNFQDRHKAARTNPWRMNYERDQRPTSDREAERREEARPQVWGTTLLPLLFVMMAPSALSAPIEASVLATGNDPQNKARILDTHSGGSQNLTTSWRGASVENTWFTLDLASSGPVTNVLIALQGGRAYELKITVGDNLQDGQVTGTAATCVIRGDLPDVPTTLESCALPASSGGYVTVRSVGRHYFRVHGVEVMSNGISRVAAPAAASTHRAIEGQKLAIDFKSTKDAVLSVSGNLPGNAVTLKKVDPTRWCLEWLPEIGTASATPYRATVTTTTSSGQTNTNLAIGVDTAQGRIQPSAMYPNYFEYHGVPLLLFGGSDYDSIFQTERSVLLSQLNLLAGLGGNYLRNASNNRSLDTRNGAQHRFDQYLQPHARTASGKYDLNQWNEAYWEKLQVMLNAAHARGIIVQLEIWDAYAVIGKEGWALSAWNPDNNVNYTWADTNLRPLNGMSRQFFEAVPALNNDTALLKYQQKYVSRLISIARQYDNVLYQIDNESFLPEEVARYWAEWIQRQTAHEVYVADSRRYHPQSYTQMDFQLRSHPETLVPVSRSDIFGYLDIAQNGGNSGQIQYDNLVWYRAQVNKVAPRPINHVKLYRFDWPTGTNFADRKATTEAEAGAKFWRTVFGGGASVRFHRRVPFTPAPGLGLGELASAHIRAMRVFADQFPVVNSEPRASGLALRTEDEAYQLTAGPELAIYFTGNGDRRVQLTTAGKYAVRWLNIQTGALSGAAIECNQCTLQTPAMGQWVALMKKTAS